MWEQRRRDGRPERLHRRQIDRKQRLAGMLNRERAWGRALEKSIAIARNTPVDLAWVGLGTNVAALRVGLPDWSLSALRNDACRASPSKQLKTPLPAETRKYQ